MIDYIQAVLIVIIAFLAGWNVCCMMFRRDLDQQSRRYRALYDAIEERHALERSAWIERSQNEK